MEKGILRQMIEVDCALAATYLVGRWAVQCAYVERGYRAVGSEWLLIILVYLGTYKAVCVVFGRIGLKRGAYGEYHKEKGCGGADRMRHCR